MKECNKSSTLEDITTDKVVSIIKILNNEKASKSNDMRTKVIQELGTFLLNYSRKTSIVALKPAFSLKT